MTAERPLDEAFLSDRTDAAFSAVAEPRRADDADVLRRLCGLIAFGKGFNELRGFKDAAAGAEDAEGGFIGNVLDSFFGRENGNSAVERFGRANVMGDVSGVTARGESSAAKERNGGLGAAIGATMRPPAAAAKAAVVPKKGGRKFESADRRNFRGGPIRPY